MTLFFATGNRHKAAELAALLAPHTVKIPADAGFSFEPDENGADFLSNALIKARALFDLVHEPVLADDSGLCIDALGGRPGIFSARYGSVIGKTISSEERNALVLAEMAGKTERSARFVCAMVLLYRHERFCAVQETLEGAIARSPAGIHGFGYDPIFYLPDRSCSLAELPEVEKNKISHRGKAARMIRALL